MMSSDRHTDTSGAAMDKRQELQAYNTYVIEFTITRERVSDPNSRLVMSDIQTDIQTRVMERLAGELSRATTTWDNI
jgi:phosphoribosylamine-glycine ligase